MTRTASACARDGNILTYVAFDGLLNITTADAVLVLLKNHSIAELRSTPSWTLAEMMQNARLDLYQINPDDQTGEPFCKKAS